MANSNNAQTLKRKWRMSSYTQIVRADSGDLLLHNSFMGAIARVPKNKLRVFEECHTREFQYLDLVNENFGELCDTGFFVPSDISERTIVNEIIAKERESGFHIIILPHENCNFRCVYCYEKFERGKMKSDVVSSLKTFVAKKAEDVRTLSVAWFGGEPLLARDLIYELSDSFLHSCKRMGVTYNSGITTNGYLLTEEVVDSLLQRKVSSYQITLDGPENVHNKNRSLAGGGETYRKILNNLAALRNRPENFSVKVRVNFSAQHTLPLMKEFLGEVYSLFQGDARFDLHFHPVGKWGGSNDSSLAVCEARDVGEVRTGLMKEALELGFPSQMAKQHLRPHGNVCYASKETSIVVGSDGAVYKCTVAFDDQLNHVGRITGDGQLVINQARWDLWTKLDGKNVSKCTACSFSPACQSRGCPLVAIRRKEPPCPITKAEYETTVKLVAKGTM